MTKQRWRRWRPLLAVLASAVVIAGVVLLVWLVPPALYQHVSNEQTRIGAEASTRTGLIAGLAGLAALGGLAMTARTYRLTEQGQITDWYTKAIEQLGGDKLDVRLGGIYGLERIAHDSKRDHPTVVEVLSAFVRERTDPARTEKPTVADVLNAFLTLIDGQPERNPTPSNAGTKIKLPADVQAAFTVLGHLPRRRSVSRTGDLTGAWLAGARLVGANLSGALLNGADLFGAFLNEADLSRAWLRRANLSGALLNEADLSHAWLRGANLSGAFLNGADLSGVQGLTQQQLDAARGDEDTKLPDGLQRPAYWSAAGGIASGPADE